MTSEGVVLVVGSEPAAFACALTLVEAGLAVCHVYPEPLGMRGASRDIGLAYPELGEPWERVSYSLGDDLALALLRWSKDGVEDLLGRAPEMVSRGSRLSLSRNEAESKLVSSDALQRTRPPVNDEARLMSGVAVSNYAPVHSADLGSFETHAITFTPLRLLTKFAGQLQEFENYRRVVLETDQWCETRVNCSAESVAVVSAGSELAYGDVAIVAGGMDTTFLLQRFKHSLVSLRGQAFRSHPLREVSRSSVVGITASWGFERYRFDSEQRLLGCGVNPGGSGGGGAPTEVDDKSLKKFLERAAGLFVDFDGSSEEEVMRWAVEFDGTCDGLPLLGPIAGEPRVQVACGFGLSSWARGWEAGRRMANLIALSEDARASEPLVERCSPRRFFGTGQS